MKIRLFLAFILFIITKKGTGDFRSFMPQFTAQATAKIMNEAGFDALTFTMDLSSCSSICSLIAEAQTYGEIAMLVNATGVSPSQAFCGCYSEGRFIRNSRIVGGSR